jgi:hypothetical protein
MAGLSHRPPAVETVVKVLERLSVDPGLKTEFAQKINAIRFLCLAAGQPASAKSLTLVDGLMV